MKDNTTLIADNYLLNQGSNAYVTPLIKALESSYFKSEPRTILYWIEEIRRMSDKISIDAEGTDWNDLIPPTINNKLLLDYIKDPRGSIKDGRFTEDEILQLRQPQRIMLFYFLRKLSPYQDYNKLIITEINNIISEKLFQIKRYPAIADQGFAVVNSTESTSVKIPKSAILDAVVEGENTTRKYKTTTRLSGHTLLLESFITAFRIEEQEALNVVCDPLPLQQKKTLFRDVKVVGSKNVFRPSLIISSPLLSLSEGIRKIYLWLTTLKFENAEDAEIFLFDFTISTNKGWVEIKPEKHTVVAGQDGAFIHGIEFVISPESPPITALTSKYEGDLEEEEDALPCYSGNACIKMRRVEGVGAFQVSNIALKTSVENLLPRVLRNQDLVIDPSDNYSPFGLEAPLQSIFGFSHPEFVDREIERIQLSPKWVGKPEAFDDYYKAYPRTEKNITVEIGMLYRGVDSTVDQLVVEGNKELFNPTICFNPYYSLPVQGEWLIDEPDPLVQYLSFQLKLNKENLGHNEYPLLMANYTIEKAAYDNAKIKICKEEPLPVNMPYTPQQSELRINYVAKKVYWSAGDSCVDKNSLSPSSEKSSIPSIEIFRNSPKGYTCYKGERIDLGEDENGVFYLGIKKLQHKSSSSFYFNGIAGNPNAPGAIVKWKYLAKEGWKELKSENILHDGTYNLTQTGIFYWNVPVGMVNDNTLMPLGEFWLKVNIQPAPSYDDLIPPNCAGNNLSYAESLMILNGIYANGFPIKRVDQDLVESENQSVMPEGSTIYFENPDYDFQVELPFNTEGNVSSESQLNYWARVFNRVRNRGRMVERENYEDLILYQNRDLLLVKCIPRVKCSNYVEIVVMAKINTLDFRDLKEASMFSIPFVPEHKLKEIYESILPVVSPFFRTAIKLKITNPTFVSVGFEICVKFNNEATETENKTRLFQDLQEFINPWFFKKDEIPLFGCWFSYGDLLAALQNKGYVFAVFGVKMGLIQDNKIRFPKNFQFKKNEIIVLKNQYSVNIQEESDVLNIFGIGKEEIGLDFTVTDTK